MSMLQGAFGLTISMTFGVDITGANSASIKIKDVSGKKKTVSATIDDTTTGKISYITQQSDFTKVGNYQLQGIVNFPSKKLKGEVIDFLVSESL